MAQAVPVGEAAASARAARNWPDGETADLTFNSFGVSSKTSNRSLVVHLTSPDPAITSQAEEDLATMSVILQRAARAVRDEEKSIHALGITVDGSIFGSSSGARNIYLEGYGALFLMSVRFPLVAPPEKPEEIDTKENTSTEWESARQEAQGSAALSGALAALDRATVAIGKAGLGPVEPYDAERVESLKNALVTSLKNATHIRILKPDDYVTVVVQGADVIGDMVKSKSGVAPGQNRMYKRASRGETVLTLRAKKSDCEAFAKGKLDSEAFRKKVSLQTYLRRADSPGSRPGIKDKQ